MSHKQHHTTIHLHDVQDLFVPASRNPFQSNYRPLAAIDQLALEMKLAHLKHGLHVTFVLPASAGKPAELEHEIRVGLQRYCDHMLANLSVEVEAKKRSVARSLQIGMGILAASLALAAGLSNWTFMADWLRNLLSNAVSIFGSVALWSPVDAFLFGIRPMYKNVKIFKAIRKMEMDVQLDNAEAVHERPTERPLVTTVRA